MTTTQPTIPHTPANPRGLPPRPIDLPQGVLTLTIAEMNRAIEAGAASSPLYRQDLLRYRDLWWKLSSGAWWREVTYTPAIAAYDTAAANMTPEAAEAQRTANIRAAAGITEPE